MQCNPKSNEKKFNKNFFQQKDKMIVIVKFNYKKGLTIQHLFYFHVITLYQMFMVWQYSSGTFIICFQLLIISIIYWIGDHTTCTIILYKKMCPRLISDLISISLEVFN
jgi:hypothetical protein